MKPCDIPYFKRGADISLVVDDEWLGGAYIRHSTGKYALGDLLMALGVSSETIGRVGGEIDMARVQAS